MGRFQYDTIHVEQGTAMSTITGFSKLFYTASFQDQLTMEIQPRGKKTRKFPENKALDASDNSTELSNAVHERKETR
jgi:hypothetical protein